MEKENCLIIFIKNPAFGKVKTRLAGEIGEDKALAVYLKLLNHTMSVTQNLNCSKIVYYSEFVDTEDEWENEHYHKAIQFGKNLGDKMRNAFREQFDSGFRKVCIIGSDIPELTGQVISDAFELLESFDVVIGPAYDGGYYLLGLKKLLPELFENKSWGSNQVLEQTIEDLESLNLEYYQLQKLLDIDTKSDLEKIWPKIKWSGK